MKWVDIHYKAFKGDNELDLEIFTTKDTIEFCIQGNDDCPLNYDSPCILSVGLNNEQVIDLIKHLKELIK
jgi:hypothetical protein